MVKHIPEALIDEKVEILADFRIPINQKLKDGLRFCKTEMELDRYCKQLILTALGDD